MEKTISPSSLNKPSSSAEEQPSPVNSFHRLLLLLWNYITTLKGFLITIYMLNVIAWGGMLFLLLVNAAPAMCTPTCNDLYSPRRICTLFLLLCSLAPGIEIDSQILNALFCLTGLGLLPFRARDTYHLFTHSPKLLASHPWYSPTETNPIWLPFVVILILSNSLWQIVVSGPLVLR